MNTLDEMVAALCTLPRLPVVSITVRDLADLERLVGHPIEVTSSPRPPGFDAFLTGIEVRVSPSLPVDRALVWIDGQPHTVDLPHAQPTGDAP